MRHRPRDLFICCAIAIVLLTFAEGRAVRHAGREMPSGWERSLVLAVGNPAGWLTDQVPALANAADNLSKAFKSDQNLSSGGAGSFADRSQPAAAGGVPPVTRDAFDPRSLGEQPAKRPLKTVLVTGDSMAQPLDAQLARDLAPKGIKVIRDAHIGTMISDTSIVDWGKLSALQTKQDKPDAVVMFMGANEGFPMNVGGREVKCCSADWAAEYAYRARRMMDTYRRAGAARVYWLLLPAYRSAARNKIAHVVNAGLEAASGPYRAQVRLLDMGAIFTPGDKYRDAMPVDGRDQIVRQADGVHLNATGSRLAADDVLAALREDFTGP